jgi:large subunit ribosomal protein L10
MARKENVNLFIAKNNLLKIGFKKTAYNNIDKYLKGQSLLFFSQKEISSSAKIVQTFCKNNDKLKVNIISLCGNNFSSKDLTYISNLPTKKEAIGSFISLLKMPITNLIRTVKCPSLKLLILLKELSKKK